MFKFGVLVVWIATLAFILGYIIGFRQRTTKSRNGQLTPAPSWHDGEFTLAVPMEAFSNLRY